MNTDHNDYKADEFDIEMLAEKLYRIAVRAIKKLFQPIRWLLARPGITVLLVAMAVTISYLGTRILPKSYEASFIIKPINAGDLAFINMLRDLEKLAGEHDHEQLARELQLDQETAKRIRLISGEIVWKKPSDTVNLAIISLRSAEPVDFDTLQTAVIHYLESNDHYIKALRTRLEKTGAFTARLESEINELDSLKRFLVRQTLPGNNTQIIYGEPPDLVKVYETILGLYGRQLVLNAEMQRPGNFELLKPCVASNKAVFPRLNLLLAVFLPLALLAAMAIGRRSMKR